MYPLNDSANTLTERKQLNTQIMLFKTSHLIHNSAFIRSSDARHSYIIFNKQTVVYSLNLNDHQSFWLVHQRKLSQIQCLSTCMPA